MSVDPIWYYEKNGERVGPVSGNEIIAQLSSGELSAATLLWRAGLSEWTPLAQTELASVAPQGTPSAADAASPVEEPAAPQPSSPVAESAPQPQPQQQPVGESLSPTPPHVATPFVPRAPVLRLGHVVSIRKNYGRAWTLLRSRFWPLIGCYLLISLLIGVVWQFIIPAFFVMLPLMGGLFWYILKYLRGEQVSIDLLFEGCRRQFGNLAVLNLIVSGVSFALIFVIMLPVIAAVVIVALKGDGGNLEELSPVIMSLMVGGGLLLYGLLIILMSIVSFVVSFATLLILDCELKVKDALLLGWTVTKQNLLKVIAFMILSMGLSFLGVLALYVGVFVAALWSTIALVFIYEETFGEEGTLRVWERKKAPGSSSSDDFF